MQLLTAASTLGRRPAAKAACAPLPINFVVPRRPDFKRSPAQSSAAVTGAAGAAGVAEAPLGAVTTELAAEDFSWTRQWYVVLVAELTDDTRPIPVKLLGKSLVVWKDGGGAWRCFEDRCPHRAAPLSEGKVWSDGTLMCAYHGWRFDGGGACTKVPQASSPQAERTACASPRSCAATHPVQEAQGLIFVWGEAGPQAVAQSEATPLPVDQLYAAAVARGEQPTNTIQDYVRDVPYDYATAVENVVDPSHVNFAHHGVVDSRERAQWGYAEMRRVQEADPGGGAICMEYASGAFGPGPMHIAFHPPGLVQGAYSSTNIYVTPTAPGEARVTFTGSTTAAARSLPDKIYHAAPAWFVHSFMNATLDGDNCFLHSQERIVRAKAQEGSDRKQLYFMPNSADTMVAGFRNWVESVGGGGPFGPLHQAKGYPPLITDHRVLLNRYEQHTKNCTKCAAALATVQKLRAVAAAAAAVAWGSMLVTLLQWAAGRTAAAAAAAAAPPAVPLALGAGAGLVLLLAWRALGKLAQAFYFVDYDHATR